MVQNMFFRTITIVIETSTRTIALENKKNEYNFLIKKKKKSVFCYSLPMSKK